jgi:hypothetical protein
MMCSTINFTSCFVLAQNTVSCYEGKHTLQVSENKLLMKIFGCKRDKISEECKILQNEEQCGLYISPSIARIVKSGRL